MAFPSLEEVVDDDELGQPFIIQRSTVVNAQGGTQTSVASIQAFGPIDNAQGQDLEQIPEGERIYGGIIVHSACKLYATQIDPPTQVSYLSDIIIWHELQWRIHHVSDRSNRGYYMALAVRMAGE